MTHREKRTVAVGMSGGIDSAVAVWLLKEQGWDVVGLTMSIWDSGKKLEAIKRSGCYGPGETETIAGAKTIAGHLGIPHVTLALSGAYERCVLDPFRTRYLAGITPNPCAICNPVMKFGVLPQAARAQGVVFDRFATGHYARIARDEATGRFRLLRGVDGMKDQSYFLARLSQAQLAETVFPLGDKTKQEVRELARTAGLAVLAGKRESQDFFEGADMAELFNGAGTTPGPIVDESGRVLGTHRGIIYYTVGQREGLGVAVGYKVYVKRILAACNTLVVASRKEVFDTACRVTDMHWISGALPVRPGALTVRLRYRHPGVAVHLAQAEGTSLALTFATPQFAVTPGQMAVLYDGDEVLGGGWISPKAAY